MLYSYPFIYLDIKRRGASEGRPLLSHKGTVGEHEY